MDNLNPACLSKSFLRGPALNVKSRGKIKEESNSKCESSKRKQALGVKLKRILLRSVPVAGATTALSGSTSGCVPVSEASDRFPDGISASLLINDCVFQRPAI